MNTGLPDASALSRFVLLNGCQTSWLGLVTNPYAPAASSNTHNIAVPARKRERHEETGVQNDPLIHARIAITRSIAPSRTIASTPRIWPRIHTNQSRVPMSRKPIHCLTRSIQPPGFGK
jgi:hypothetical protein